MRNLISRSLVHLKCGRDFFRLVIVGYMKSKNLFLYSTFDCTDRNQQLPDYFSPGEVFDLGTIYRAWVGEPTMTVEQIRRTRGDSADAVLVQLVQKSTRQRSVVAGNSDRQRVQIARETDFGIDEFIVLDEPTAGLDVDLGLLYSSSIGSGIYENGGGVSLNRRRTTGQSGPWKIQSLIGIDFFGLAVEENARSQKTPEFTNHDLHTAYGSNLRLGLVSEQTAALLLAMIWVGVGLGISMHCIHRIVKQEKMKPRRDAS